MQTYLVGDVLEAHLGGVVGGALLRVADPEADVVKAVELADGWLNRRSI